MQAVWHGKAEDEVEEWGAGGCVFHATRMKARPSPWGCREDGNSGGGGSDGGEGKPPPPPPGRLWESEQRCRCAAEGGPAWVPKGMNTGKRRRMRMGVRGIGATRSPQVFPMET